MGVGRTLAAPILLGLGLGISLVPKPVDASIYAQAKAEIPTNLYTPYRLLDRILSANRELSQPVALGLRSIDSSTCRNLLGETETCTLAADLPDISKSDDFKLWSLQTAGALSSEPNAYANSYTNKIILNRSLSDTLAANHEGQACVIAHEVAHIQQDHSRRYLELFTYYNNTAATKMKAAIANAHKARASNEFWTGLTLTSNEISRDYNNKQGQHKLAESLENKNNEIKQNSAADLSEGRSLLKRLLDAANGRTPSVIAALQTMEGLPASLVKRTMRDINQYFGEVNQQALALSREHELEADRLAVGYLARAGINPRGCLAVIAKLSHGRFVQPSREESSHPSYAPRLAQIELAIAANAAIYARVQSQKIPPPPLPYRYDSQLQLITVYPRMSTPGSRSPGGLPSIDSFLK